VMPGHLRVPELTGDAPATLSAAALNGLLRGELGFTGVVISDALEMRAVSDLYGIPEAAVLAVAAGTDLLCLGRDAAEDSYLAVRRALSEAVASGRLPAGRLAEARQNVARLRDWLAGAAPRARQDSAGDHIGLVAARRAVRVSAAPGPLADPVVVELEAQENIAVGDVPWGLRPWVPAASIQRIPAGLAVTEAAEVAKAALARAAGRPLIVVVRGAHRYPAVQAVVSGLTVARPDTVVLEMGLPLWVPPAGVHLATYGAARASAQAAAEVLGLVR
jgi:beta-N-acetylhexosaminidase